MKIIVKIQFGSHLYGTNTEESDLDYKGIFLPTLEQVLLGKIPKSIITKTKKGYDNKNTKDDVDTELYSLQYFIKLACEGQTVAIDMLHAAGDNIIDESDIWEEIIKNRHKFYTKNLQAFVGYAQKQAAKYGIKGSRLNAVSDVIKVLLQHDDDLKLKYIWEELPVGEHIKFSTSISDIREYEVCGRKVQETATVGYAFNVFNKYYNNYGKRAEMAARNEGIDWKAVSHALRAAYEVKSVLAIETITFPLPEAEFLKRVKSGELDYLTLVSPILEELIEEVSILAKTSDLPEEVDKEFWDKFVVDVMKEEYNIR